MATRTYAYAAAKAAKLKRYASTCQKHGIVERLVSNRSCLKCAADRQRARYAADPEAGREATRRWREKNREVMTDIRRKWYTSNLDRERRRCRDWKAKNKAWIKNYNRRYHIEHQDSLLAKSAKWKQNNLARWAALEATRKARRIRATPPWLTNEHYELIVAMYQQAHRAGFTVDHIVPLAGCRVCQAHGLHVPWNLQSITGAANCAKKDRCIDCCEAA